MNMLETQTYTLQIEECDDVKEIAECLSPIRKDITVLRSRMSEQTSVGFVLIKSDATIPALRKAFTQSDAYVTFHTGDQVDDLYRQEQLNYVN